MSQALDGGEDKLPESCVPPAFSFLHCNVILDPNTKMSLSKSYLPSAHTDMLALRGLSRQDVVGEAPKVSLGLL